MLKTVKSKILAIAIFMLAFLLIAFACYGGVFRMKTKQLMLQNYIFAVDTFVNRLNEKVVRLEDNSEDLALIGKLAYKTDKDIALTKKSIKNIFENYDNSLGGGIWYEPYTFDKSQKRTCLYIFRNRNNQLVFDESFASEEYDYHNRSWYKEIKSKIKKEHDTAWSLPYYEEIGSETMMITVGTGIFADGKLVGISTIDWDLKDLFAEIMRMAPIERGFSFFEARDTIKGSFALFASKADDYIIVSNTPYVDNLALTGKPLSALPWYRDNLRYVTYMTYHGKKYVPIVKDIKNGMLLIICIPKSEMFTDINKFVFMMLLILAFLAILIPTVLYFGLDRYIIKPIYILMNIARKVSRGEDIKIQLNKPEEFAQLASAFDKMTTNIKKITMDREKINNELNIAKSIQASSLPSVFPPFPDRKEFDIFASMDAAKEVGGDFYDFYFKDDQNFMFLVADVSGKGIPAALFMMTSKTLIENLSQFGFPPSELIYTINNKICQNNKEGLFVTMLAGIINLNTGRLSLMNCGHNQPLIKRKGGSYEYMNLDSNMVLGVFENVDFNIYETEMNPGDSLFIYTDGITEATNASDEMYGENRLQECLNSIKTIALNKISEEVKKNIKEFTLDYPQSDDITMLIFKYNGQAQMKEMTYKDKAVIENYKPCYTWLHGACEEWGLNEELKNTLDMCSEEIFANVTFYAYPFEQGEIEVYIKNEYNTITLKFIDSGLPYNPLEKPDPDITLPPEDRPLGGLGIYMVKQMAREVIYERIDDKNILTLIFDC
ncbi:SpoIIE family protein phosphatase [bacterium]|nr:SpoIIE family protein phosphatase [bacterium]